MAFFVGINFDVLPCLLRESVFVLLGSRIDEHKFAFVTAVDACSDICVDKGLFASVREDTEVGICSEKLVRGGVT